MSRSMNNIWIRRTISVFLLALALLISFTYYCKLVQYPRNNFYEFYNDIESNRLDVLCVGSSHLYCGINPVQMYEDYGIAAFNLACGSQAVWHSYHYIKQALKNQQPKLVILDVYTVPEKIDYFNTRVTQMNLLNMPSSFNKWMALNAADPDNKAEIYFGFPITHSRYTKLERNDYNLRGNMNTNFLGYAYKSKIVPYEEGTVKDVREVSEIVSIPEKAEKYLRKSIELCLEKDIDIILTNAPWPDITEEKQKQYNYIQIIADEYGIPFLNGCLYNEEIGLDYTVDSMGDGGHLNHSGVTKYTKWLSEYLVNTYNLPDRRGEKQYEAWEHQADKLKAVIRRERLAQAEDIQEILDELYAGESLYYVVSLNGEYNNTLSGGLLAALTSKGINTEQNGTYVMNAGEQLFYSHGEKGYKYYKYFDDSVLFVYDDNGNNEITWNRNAYSIVQNGINILVYDELLDEIVGKIAFDADNGYNIIRGKGPN